jgi:hypothetical protein
MVSNGWNRQSALPPTTFTRYHANDASTTVTFITTAVAIRVRPNDRRRAMSIWTILFVILLVAWIGGFTVFHVAGGLIHLLLVLAVISLVLHFVTGAPAA